jgi:hypothetical protein
MTIKRKKNPFHGSDDPLFGLLTPYKAFNTYVRILLSEDEKLMVLQITSNPRFWYKERETRYKAYTVLSRLDSESMRLFIKYVQPEHIIQVLGTELGLKLPEGTIIINDELEEHGIYSLEISARFRKKIIAGVHKLVKLSSRKKYEILEKSHSTSDVLESL